MPIRWRRHRNDLARLLMPLPEIIEIMPLEAPVSAVITVPGSKSITNRALILAALADGATTLRGASSRRSCLSTIARR